MYIRIGCLCVWCVCSPGLARGSGHRQMGKSPKWAPLCVPEPVPCFGQARGWKGRLRGGRAAGQGPEVQLPLVLVGLEAPSQGRGDFSRWKEGAPKTLPLLHPLLSLPSSPSAVGYL